MRVWVEPSQRRVSPFLDPASELRIGDRTLAAWQAQAFRDAGLEVIDRFELPCLVVPDNLWTTGAALTAFIRAAEGRDAVLGLKTGVFHARVHRLQPCWREAFGGWIVPGVRLVLRNETPQIVWMDAEEQVISLPVPEAMRDRPEGDQIGLPKHPMMTIEHWAHLLWASQAAGALEARNATRWQGVWALLRAVMAARSINRWRVLGKLNRIGRGCDIHPTAVVEASTLGDGVVVGAFARVFGSQLGDGAVVMPGAQVEVSTLGAGATVAQQSVLRACVVYPDAFMSQSTLQACVVGQSTFMTQASYSLDFSFEGNVRVKLDGRLADSGTRFLGSAFGHRARVGAGIWLAPGREVPNDTTVVLDPGEIVCRPPIEGGRYVVRGGVVSPWAG